MRYSDCYTRHRSRLCKEVGGGDWAEFKLCDAHRKKTWCCIDLLSPSDNKYIERVRKISAKYSLGLTIYPIDGGGASKSGEKEFWITSSGKTHNSSCRYYGTTKSGRYSDKPSGDSCKVCGG